MKSSPRFPFNEYILISLVLFLFANCFFYTYHNAIPLVKSDGWRFVQIYLVPWYEGHFNWSILWSDHHPQPLTATLFIFNAEIFGLRMDYEALFAIPFLLFSLILINKSIKQTLSPNRNIILYYILIALIASVLFSLTSTAPYTWSLVSLGIVARFFSVLAIQSIDIYLYRKQTAAQITLTIIGLSALLIMFSSSAKVYLYSCLAVLLINIAFTPNKKYCIAPAAVIIASIIFQRLFFSIVGDGGKYGEKELIISIVENSKFIEDYILYIGTGLSSAWLNLPATSKLLGITQESLAPFSAFILLFYIVTLFVYFRKGLSTKSTMPGTLILASLLTAIGAAIFRYNPETQSFMAGNVPRYYTLYGAGMIGVLWTWAWVLIKAPTSRIIHIFSVVMVFLILSSQFVSSASAWRKSTYLHKSILNTHSVMLRNSRGDLSVKPPRFMVGSNYPEPYLKSLSFLAEYNLNLFNDDNLINKYE